MKRYWNWRLWTGVFLVIAGLFSYVPIFAQFPITRDFPWVNLLLFLAGGILLAAGLKRAFVEPDLYRGRIIGSIAALLCVAGIGFFAFGLLYIARQLPPAAEAPRAGQKAPDFSLPDQNGKSVTLASLLASRAKAAAGQSGAALLIFYRGYW